MDNIIKVKPDTNGKLFITLYGMRYQIVVEDASETAKKKK